MSKETTRKLIKLITYCHAYIPDTGTLSHNKLSSLLSNLPELNEWGDPERELLFECQKDLSGNKKPSAIFEEIDRQLEKIKDHLNPKQKLGFIICLLKLTKIESEGSGFFIDDILYAVAEKFGYSITEINSIKKLFISDEITDSDYPDSILITYENSDYKKIVDGLKTIYNPDFKFKIWVKNIRSVNNMLFKILEFKDGIPVYGINKNEIIIYNTQIQEILGQCKISLDQLSGTLISSSDHLPHINIEASEKSPRISLSPDTFKIEIEGVSMVHQLDQFYEPIFYWLDKLKTKKPEKLEMHINMTFFNTYTSRMLLKLLIHASKFEQSNCQVKYFWYYEDDDDEMKEAGEHYEVILNKDFSYITLAADASVS